MSEYDETMSANDLDVATPLDGASVAEVYKSIRQIKSVLKNVILRAHLPSGAARADGSISAASLADGAVNSAILADLSVLLRHMAVDSVGAEQMLDNSIETAHIIDGAVETDKLAANSVTSSKLDRDSVDTNALRKSDTDAVRPVTSDTIRNDSVTDEKITDVGLQKLTGGADGDMLFKVGGVWTAVNSGGDLTYDPVTGLFSVASGLDLATFGDQKTSATNGGDGTVATWNQRDLGALVDTSNIQTFIGNAFTLLEGEYFFYAEVPACDVGLHRAKLMKTASSDSAETTVVLGTSINSISRDTSTSILCGGFEVTDVNDTYEIQHYLTSSVVAGRDFGEAVGDGELEVYTRGWLARLGG